MPKRKQRGSKKIESKPANLLTTIGQWFVDHKRDFLYILILYLICLALFNKIIIYGMAFSNSGDTANHYSYKVVGDRIEETEGVSSLWNPYVFGGIPTFGNLSYMPHDGLGGMKGVNYLERIIIEVTKTLFFRSTWSWLVSFYFLGGVFMFCLMRCWNYSREASFLAGLVFLLSPHAIGLAEVGHGTKVKALSFLPFVMIFLHFLFKYRGLISFGALSAAIGTLMLTNHIQIVYYVFLIMGAYLLYHIITDLRDNKKGLVLKKVGLFVGALLLGMAISSYIYLSVYEYAQFSIRGGGTAGSTGGLTWDYATNWSMHPLELVTLLIPSFFGFTSPFYWGWMPFTSSTVYLGIVPIVMATVASIFNWRDWFVRFLLIVTGFVLLVSFGKHVSFLYHLFFEYLPFFDKFRAPSTILHLLPFTLGILAAIGFKTLNKVTVDRKRLTRIIKNVRITLGVLAGFLIIGIVMKSVIYEALVDFTLVKEGEVELYTQQYGARAQQAIDQLKEIRFYGNDQIAGLWGDFIRFCLFSIAVLTAVYLYLRAKMKLVTFSVALSILLAIDLILISAKFINPVPSPGLQDSVRPDATIQFLRGQVMQDSLVRVLPMGQHYGDMRYGPHKIQSMGGYSAAKLKIYQTVVDSCLYRPVEAGLPVNMNIVNMLNAKYIVSSFPLPPQRFAIVHADESRRKFVFENQGALPRAFFVDSVAVGPSDDGILEMMNSPSFDPARTAILHSAPDALPGRPDSTHAEVTEFESRKITVQAFTSSPGLLVLSEIYYPAGWNAYIDGEPAEILRANYILRSIVVPSGEHEIELRFEPASYEAGWAITHTAWSLTALCIIVGLLSLPVIRQRIGLKPKAQPRDDERHLNR